MSDNNIPKSLDDLLPKKNSLDDLLTQKDGKEVDIGIVDQYKQIASHSILEEAKNIQETINPHLSNLTTNLNFINSVKATQEATLNFSQQNILGQFEYLPRYLGKEMATYKLNTESLLRQNWPRKSDISLETMKILFNPRTTAENELKKLNFQRNKSEEKIEELKSEILYLKNDKLKQDEKIKSLEHEAQAKDKLSKLQDLLPRLSEKGGQGILVNEKLKASFFSKAPQKSAVLSVDIRKSTDLMLYAISPEEFSYFITDLIKVFEEIIKDNFGVFDKFTGDGILAFFPEFYCGADSLFFALRSAKLCHEIFKLEYEKKLDSFKIIKADVGLGIGIDHGDLCLATISDKLTVVGEPVVFACRFGAAPAGHTILNQGAMTKIKKLYQPHFVSNKVPLDIKNQGAICGYEVELNFDAITPKVPDWLTELNQEEAKKIKSNK